jgi:hypothetical protein
MDALNNIVTLGIAPDDGASLSGFQLINAPGITLKTLNNIANETYTKGVNLALLKKSLSTTQFYNDFIGALQANRVMTTISEPLYDTSVFNPNNSVGSSTMERGIELWRNVSYRGTLRKLIVKNVQLFPLASGTATLKIYDGFTETDYAVNLTANQVNTFAADYTVNEYSKGIKVLVDAPSIPFASAAVICGQGCNNSMPNPCGFANGWSGAAREKHEGYGVNVQFQCHCDYSQIITDMANSFTGELIYLKWQYNIWEEQYKTDRFSTWCVYNREDIKKEILPDIEARYNEKWNAMMDGLYQILLIYRDDCLNCRGIRLRTNI